MMAGFAHFGNENPVKASYINRLAVLDEEIYSGGRH